MSKRRRLAVSVLVILAVTCLGLIFELRARPPLIWNGKPAQYWIGRLTFLDLGNGNPSAEEFLFAAGPEVVPELIRGLSSRNNRFSDLWHALYFKLGKWQRFFQPPTKPPYYRANCAIGLGLLGPAASNAAPALLRALKDEDPYLRAKAAEALGRIGADKPHVVAELAAGLSSTNSNCRLGCVIGLCHCLPGGPEAASALRRAIQDPDANTRAWAAENIRRDDSNREATFTALVNALQDRSAVVRDRAAQSLGQMGFDQPEAAEALVGVLGRELRPEGNVGVVWKAVASLGDLGPAARAAIPLLTSLSIRTNGHTATLSLIALSRIQPDNPYWMDELTKRLDDASSSEVFWVAWELGRRGKAAGRAVEPLRRLAGVAADWQTKAMAHGSSLAARSFVCRPHQLHHKSPVRSRK